MKRFVLGGVFGVLSTLGVANQEIANEMLYNPIAIRSGQEISDQL